MKLNLQLRTERITPSSAVPLIKNIVKLPFSSVLRAYYAHGFFKSPLLEPVDVIQERMYAWGILNRGEFLVKYDEKTESFVVGFYDNSIEGKRNWKDKLKKFINDHL